MYVFFPTIEAKFHMDEFNDMWLWFRGGGLIVHLLGLNVKLCVLLKSIHPYTLPKVFMQVDGMTRLDDHEIRKLPGGELHFHDDFRVHELTRVVLAYACPHILTSQVVSKSEPCRWSWQWYPWSARGSRRKLLCV